MNTIPHGYGYGAANTKRGLTPSQKCRLEVADYLNPLIDELIDMGEENTPVIDWMWDMGNEFVVSVKVDTVQKWKEAVICSAKWMWKDQFGNVFEGGRMRSWKKLLYLPAPSPEEVTGNTQRSIPQFLWATNYTTPPNRTEMAPYVYDLRPYAKCDRIEMEEYRNTNIPAPDTKIGLCSKFKGGHHLVAPFVAYHRLIGVQHFWFYVNEEVFNISDLPQTEYITYVPYPFTMEGRKQLVGGDVRPRHMLGHVFQTEAQQQCLYRAKRYGLDWIMTNDLDEYLWVNAIEEQDELTVKKKNGSSLVTTTAEVAAASPPPPSHSPEQEASVLARFLKKYEDNPKLGAVRVDGWAFGGQKNHQNAYEDRSLLPIDLTTRAVVPTGGRFKLIYRVPTARKISVHWLYDGGYTTKTNVETEIQWRHYRRAAKNSGASESVFQSGRNPLVEDTKLRDKYRDSIVEWMREHAPSSSRIEESQDEV